MDGQTYRQKILLIIDVETKSTFSYILMTVQNNGKACCIGNRTTILRIQNNKILHAAAPFIQKQNHHKN